MLGGYVTELYCRSDLIGRHLCGESSAVVLSARGFWQALYFNKWRRLFRTKVVCIFALKILFETKVWPQTGSPWSLFP
jgi:hypothetical protein